MHQQLGVVVVTFVGFGSNLLRLCVRGDVTSRDETLPPRTTHYLNLPPISVRSVNQFQYVTGLDSELRLRLCAEGVISLEEGMGSSCSGGGGGGYQQRPM